MAIALSEWTGHAPLLEEELALANIALDLIGQARLLYAEAGAITGQTEDQLAYLRDAPAWRNALIMELPNGDFAFTIARLLLVSVTTICPGARRRRPHMPASRRSRQRQRRKPRITCATPAEWLVRLGDGTAESHRRAQDAIDALWPYTGELFESDAADHAMIDADVLPDPDLCAPPGTRSSTPRWRAPR